METLTLLPLSQSEIESQTENWIDSAYAERILKAEQPALSTVVLRKMSPACAERTENKRAR
jgi:hypothetical protein